MIGWFSVALAPHTRMQAARSMSLNELVAAPAPSISFMAVAVGA